MFKTDGQSVRQANLMYFQLKAFENNKRLILTQLLTHVKEWDTN